MNSRHILKKIVINSLIVFLAYTIANMVKYGSYNYQYTHSLDVLMIILISNLFIKFSLKSLKETGKGYFKGIFSNIIAGIYLLFLVSFIIVGFKFYELSRFLVLGSVGMIIVADLVGFTIRYFRNNKPVESRDAAKEAHNYRVIAFLAIDVIIWLISFYIMELLSIFEFSSSYTAQKTFIMLSGLWLGCSLITHKFTTNLYNNFWYLISPLWKTTVLIGAGTAFLRLIFGGFFVSNWDIVLLLFVFLSLEIVAVITYYLFCRVSGKEQDYEGNINVNEVVNEYDSRLEEKEFAIDSLTQFVEARKQNNTIRNLQDLIDFIATIPKLKKVKHDQTKTFDTEHLFNIEGLKKHSLHLLINLHQINDFPTTNKYFLTIYRKLVPGGYFVSKVRTITLHKERFFKKYPKFMAHFFYAFHYLFNRIFPYTPILQKIHYLLTSGRRTTMAKAEALGRLYYCGFKVVSTHIIGDYLYFVSQKSKFPALKEIPSTDLIIKLKRVGMNGRVFNLYKFRTMYPYSEFLQEYIYELNNLQENGKIQEDFRVTGWGKVMRKFWLDELPQLINYLRGDIGIFGARALSHHYFSLYPPSVRKLRIQFKNGLVPPFYADLPKTFDEIVESERRYFERKKKQPFKTDMIYFSRAMKNIFLRKARSM